MCLDKEYTKTHISLTHVANLQYHISLVIPLQHIFWNYLRTVRSLEKYSSAGQTEIKRDRVYLMDRPE